MIGFAAADGTGGRGMAACDADDIDDDASTVLARIVHVPCRINVLAGLLRNPLHDTTAVL
jgi:hypothetical protein